MSDGRPSVEIHPGWLRVRFAAGSHADFHARWLRHQCDQDRHPVTGERIVCSSDLPPRIEAAEAWIDTPGERLHVRWAGEPGRESVYALAWMAEHAYAGGREAAPPPPSAVGPFLLETHPDADPRALARTAVDRVASVGAVVGRGFRPDTEALIDGLCASGLTVIETHFGRIEDLRTDNTTNRNTDQLGYTDAPVDVHTDQPFLDRPPRYQLLHCMRPAEEGGESALVDAHQAALHLRDLDAEAFELLTTVPVAFHRRQEAFERRLEAPILSKVGEPSFQIRYSYFTMAPHRLPFARMEAWYRAYDRFARLVRDPAHQVRCRLGPGDFVLYDNHRMLHARTGFRGARWMRGVYFDPAGA